MNITSLEIKQHDFEKSFRGYSVEEVNAYLDTIALEWDKITNESKMLKMQLEIAEKETSKLREVEMTLIKTLRTAEETSNKITESANISAAKRLDEIELEASQTLNNARNNANAILENAKKEAEAILTDAQNQSKILKEDAEQKSNSINETAKKEFAVLEKNYTELEAQRNNLLEEIKKIVSQGQAILDANKNITIQSDDTVMPAKENATETLSSINVVSSQNSYLNDNDSNEKLIANAINEDKKPIETEEEVSFSSVVNEIKLETADNRSDFEIIEGIGPKIKEVLYNARILTFRDLATTPQYRVKDILEAAGPHFAIHDPSTWMDQAKLAEAGKWEELTALKDYLIAGRKPAEPEEKPETTDAITDEMLEKVNKVKAALRKSMVEKTEAILPVEKPKTVNDFLAEKRQQGGSFFDNI